MTCDNFPERMNKGFYYDSVCLHSDPLNSRLSLRTSKETPASSSNLEVPTRHGHVTSTDSTNQEDAKVCLAIAVPSITSASNITNVVAPWESL